MTGRFSEIHKRDIFLCTQTTDDAMTRIDRSDMLSSTFDTKVA